MPSFSCSPRYFFKGMSRWGASKVPVMARPDGVILVLPAKRRTSPRLAGARGLSDQQHTLMGGPNQGVSEDRITAWIGTGVSTATSRGVDANRQRVTEVPRCSSAVATSRRLAGSPETGPLPLGIRIMPHCPSCIGTEMSRFRCPKKSDIALLPCPSHW